MKLFAVVMMALVAFSSFGQAVKDKNDSIKSVVKNDTLPPIKLTPLQVEDVHNYQSRVKEFQIRVEAESNALQREYRAMMHSTIRANNVAEYADWILEGDQLRVIVPKKKKP